MFFRNKIYNKNNYMKRLFTYPKNISFNQIKYGNNMVKWRPPSPSELTSMIFNMGLTYLE